jgi:glucan 1,3-beta-glucosidase
MVRSFLGPLLALAVAYLSSAMGDDSSLQLYGINYNTRIGPDWEAADKKCKTADAIDADLKVIASVAQRIRIYSLTDCNQGDLVLAAAKRQGLQVELGLWVSKDESVFLAEKARLVELITTSGLITKQLVTAIHVGSEAVYRKDVTAAQNIEYMTQIKKIVTDQALKIPVTIADIGDVYIAHPELVDAVDFVSANGFPFWENKPVVGAAAYFQSRMQPLMEMAKEKKKEFVISETGWASDGVNVNASIASPGNAAVRTALCTRICLDGEAHTLAFTVSQQYFKEFHQLAVDRKWSYYYFEAFDEPWKIARDPHNTVEGYFGIFHANGTMKSEFKAILKGAQESAQVLPDKAPSGNSGTAAETVTGQSPSAHPDCPL